MRSALVVVLLGIVVWGTVYAADAQAASAPGACPLWKAERRVTTAERALVRTQARVREARHVASATRTYSSAYGAATGRWVLAARRAGWAWADIRTLMLVVYTESRGNPNAWTGYYAGLLQFGRPWWEGKWDPFYGPTNLRHGAQAHDVNGWAPWPWLAQ